jgi:hypothetical protein
MRLIVSLLFLGFALLTEAKEKALPECPNKAIQALVQTGDEPTLDAEVIFRLQPSGKSIGSFQVGGYSSYAELLWSPDGKYAALQTHFSRHTMELFVFRVSSDGIRQVKIQDYTQNIYGRVGVLHGGRGFVDKPLKWLSPDRLLISAAGTLDRSDSDNYDYEVEIRIAPNGDDFVG